MKKLRTTRVSLTVIIIFLSLAAAGALIILFRTVSSLDDTNANATTASNQVISKDNVTDFNSCKDAGNPVMESFPERCIHNGVSYTSLPYAQGSPENGGLRVSSSGNKFSMVVPKGMKLVRDMSVDVFKSTGYQSSLTENPEAEVIDVGGTGGDGPVMLMIFSPGENGVAEPEGQGAPITLGTATGTRYIMRYTADTERGLGQRDKGDVGYDYRLKLPNGTEIVAWYNIFVTDPVDNTALVESMLATLQTP